MDRYGRKKPLLVGLAIYVGAALGCAWSPNIWWLIGTRLVLALGGCVGMVAYSAIIRDYFSGDDVAKAFSSILLVMGVAPLSCWSVCGRQRFLLLFLQCCCF
ncbi:MFS transporter [Sinomicrobium sp.]